ncbi:DUF2515 family protein [Marinicrinis sediminis]|uniref:DUF2515 family protein n=1 Tax=Marinicrinis sediminis TaxID=1652465 RepID=A0ABW5R7G2_9BACL
MRWKTTSKLWNQIMQTLVSVPLHGIEWWNERSRSQEAIVPRGVYKQLEQQLKRCLAEPSSPVAPMTATEQAIVQRIEQETKMSNLNNVTRTQAYLDMYQQHPELHWAFLAHMVSRNGGWSMTDLKGEWLPRLLPADARRHLFQFLERANSYIFQDAYPQLALYRESIRHDQNLMPLLSHFHVSRFMQPIWAYFWRTRHAPLLSTALIVNEQHYIEERIVRQPFFQKHVLMTPAFQLQSLLQLNQICFPQLRNSTEISFNASQKPLPLNGLILEDFSDLQERIDFGKALYQLLFHTEPARLKHTVAFATARPHSGSRADYWPHLYRSVRPDPEPQTYIAKLKHCRLIDPDKPLYSPSLRQSWPNEPFVEPDRTDWFQARTKKAITCLKSMASPVQIHMEKEVCFGLRKIESAVLAGDWFHHLASPSPFSSPD